MRHPIRGFRKLGPTAPANEFARLLAAAAETQGIRGAAHLAIRLGVKARDIAAVNRGKPPPASTARLWARMLGADEDAFAKAAQKQRGAE